MNTKQSNKQRSDATKQRIMECIEGRFAHTVRAIAHRLGMSGPYVHARLRELVEDGRLARFYVKQTAQYVLPGDQTFEPPATVPNARIIREKHVTAPLRKNYISARMTTPLGGL